MPDFEKFLPSTEPQGPYHSYSPKEHGSDAESFVPQNARSVEKNDTESPEELSEKLFEKAQEIRLLWNQLQNTCAALNGYLAKWPFSRANEISRILGDLVLDKMRNDAIEQPSLLTFIDSLNDVGSGKGAEIDFVAADFFLSAFGKGMRDVFNIAHEKATNTRELSDSLRKSLEEMQDIYKRIGGEIVEVRKIESSRKKDFSSEHPSD